MLQNATPLNISDEHVSCLGFTSHCRRFTSLPQKRLRSLLYCARNAKSIFADLPQMSHTCHRFGYATKLSRFAHFGRVQNPFRLPHKTTLQRPKVACCVFGILTSNIFEMCFAPQWCTSLTSELPKALRG